jgi:hypothetical protein
MPAQNRQRCRRESATSGTDGKQRNDQRWTIGSSHPPAHDIDQAKSNCLWVLYRPR